MTAPLGALTVTGLPQALKVACLVSVVEPWVADSSASTGSDVDVATKRVVFSVVFVCGVAVLVIGVTAMPCTVVPDSRAAVAGVGK